MSRNRLLALLTVVTIGLFASDSHSAPRDTAEVLERLRQSAKLMNLQAAAVQDAIDSAAYELSKTQQIDLAVSFDELLMDAAAAGHLKSAGSGFSNPRFKLWRQAISITLDYTGFVDLAAFGKAQIQAVLSADLSPTVSLTSDARNSEAHVRFGVSSLQVRNLKITLGGRALGNAVDEVAQQLANQILTPARDLLSSFEVRVPTAIAVKIDIPPSRQPGIVYTVTPQPNVPDLKIVTVPYLIDSGRFFVAAQEGGSPTDAERRSHVAFDEFRTAFKRILRQTGAAWIDRGQLAAFVGRALLQRLMSRTLGGAPICAHVNILTLPVPFVQKLQLPPLEDVDCSQTKNCQQNEECNQTDECRACLLRNFGGGCVTYGNDPLCEARKGAARLACEARKVEKKAQCEAEKTILKGGCEFLKEGYKLVLATGQEYADVSSDDLTLRGDGQVCLRDPNFDAENLALSVNLAVQASVQATGSIKFRPLNVVGHAFTCFAPYDVSVAERVEVPPQEIGANSKVTFSDASSSVSAEVSFSNHIQVRLPVSTLTRQIALDPKFTIFCPIPSTLMKIRASTPDSWWPSQLRDDMEKELPGFRFDVALLQKPVTVGDLQFTGQLRRNANGFGGQFALADVAHLVGDMRLTNAIRSAHPVHSANTHHQKGRLRKRDADHFFVNIFEFFRNLFFGPHRDERRYRPQHFTSRALASR